MDLFPAQSKTEQLQQADIKNKTDDCTIPHQYAEEQSHKPSTDQNTSVLHRDTGAHKGLVCENSVKLLRSLALKFKLGLQYFIFFCLFTLQVKNLFLISKLSISCHSFMLLPRVRRVKRSAPIPPLAFLSKLQTIIRSLLSDSSSPGQTN